MPPAPPHIQVILASIRRGRFGEKPAAWLMDRLSTRSDLSAELIDLRDHPLPIFDQPAPPTRTLREYPNEEIARWGRTIDQADGYIVITPEYNHGYPASLKNALDYVFPSSTVSRSRSSAMATSGVRGRSSSCASSRSSSRWPLCATRSTSCRT